jgi:ribulose 1,5-bisphosphate synthetase/thiazole synthase
MVRASIAVLLFGASVGRAEEHKADVIVYGGTAAGVVAAYAAAKEGKSVLLVEPGLHLGGMVSGGFVTLRNVDLSVIRATA